MKRRSFLQWLGIGAASAPVIAKDALKDDMVRSTSPGTDAPEVDFSFDVPQIEIQEPGIYDISAGDLQGIYARTDSQVENWENRLRSESMIADSWANLTGHVSLPGKKKIRMVIGASPEDSITAKVKETRRKWVK